MIRETCGTDGGEWNLVRREPGRDMGALYQQNTLRDAVVRRDHLNIFNRHADRVQMANIAQMVNVLQAMILTDKEKMILTPTLLTSSGCTKCISGATVIQLS